MDETFRKPIWFGVALVVIILAIAGWLYFLQPQGSLNLGIQLSTNPANVLVGDPFTLSVMLANDSNSELKNVSVALILPDSVTSVDSPAEQVITQSVGDVDKGGVSHEDFQLIATNPQNTVFHFVAEVVYSTPDSSAQFENDGTLDLPVGQPEVSLNVNAPASVFSGQTFPIAVSYNNNAPHPVSGLTLAMQYPAGAFTFSKASSSPLLATNGNSSWSLGTLPANASGTLTVEGNLVGPNGGSYPVGAALLENIGGQNEIITNPVASVALADSPLTLTLSLNGSTNYIATNDDDLNYTLTYQNNSTVTFQNIIVTASPVGKMFDLPSLQTNGSFNSINNTITWNAASVPDLASLAPGQSGVITFSVRTQNAFPIRLLSDKDYTVSVAAKLTSPTVPAGTTANGTISVANLTTKFGGDISLAETAYHHDPSPLSTTSTNSGPYPPKVNQPTEYSIHWLITNYATDADNVSVSAYLQSGTSCTGLVKAPASSTFSCDSSNGLVTWQIPVIPATTGITDPPLEAVFQISNTPAVNQVNQDVTLLGPVSLTATDAFTSSTMQSSVQAITTALPDDTSVATNQRQVTQ